MAKTKKKKPVKTIQNTTNVKKSNNATKITLALFAIGILATCAIIYIIYDNTRYVGPFYELKQCSKAILSRGDDKVELSPDSVELDDLINKLNQSLPRKEYIFFPVDTNSTTGEFATAIDLAKTLELVLKEPNTKDIPLSETKSMTRTYDSLVFFIDSAYSGMIAFKKDGVIQPGTVGKLNISDGLIEKFNQVFDSTKEKKANSSSNT